MTRRVGLFAACSIAVLPTSAFADEPIRFSAIASSDIGYASNPFSGISSDASGSGSGFFELDLRPQAKLVMERSVLVLDGSVDYQRYFRRYGDSVNYRANLDYSATPSARLTTHGRVSYSNTVVGRFDDFTDITDPTAPPVDVGTDLGLFGSRDRRSTVNVAGDMGLKVSARDSINASAFFMSTRYKRLSNLGNYDGYGGTLGYSRQLSERTQVGLQGTVSRYDYEGLLGDTNVYSIQGTFGTTIGERWKLDGAVGVSFTDKNTGPTRASLSGNVSLCRKTDRQTICATARRAVMPTGISGTQNSTNVGASYGYKVSERGTVSLTADYIENGTNQFGIVRQNQYARATASYEHDVRERVSVKLMGRYRQIFGNGARRTSDYGGQIGISVKLGDNR